MTAIDSAMLDVDPHQPSGAIGGKMYTFNAAVIKFPFEETIGGLELPSFLMPKPPKRTRATEFGCLAWVSRPYRAHDWSISAY
ncbi:hypothetical protein, partial [Nitratireductor luteus]|uniref:hypothetical protein n=1 Tax=Nitratireductor luteus TaxID=2976980 RepID=UPI00223EFCE1